MGLCFSSLPMEWGLWKIGLWDRINSSLENLCFLRSCLRKNLPSLGRLKGGFSADITVNMTSSQISAVNSPLGSSVTSAVDWCFSSSLWTSLIFFRGKWNHTLAGDNDMAAAQSSAVLDGISDCKIGRNNVPVLNGYERFYRASPNFWLFFQFPTPHNVMAPSQCYSYYFLNTIYQYTRQKQCDSF